MTVRTIAQSQYPPFVPYVMLPPPRQRRPQTSHALAAFGSFESPPPTNAPHPSQDDTRPAIQAPLPSSQVHINDYLTKRGREEDTEPQEHTKRAKALEDRIRELEEELRMDKEASAKREKELSTKVNALKKENEQLKAQVRVWEKDLGDVVQSMSQSK